MTERSLTNDEIAQCPGGPILSEPHPCFEIYYYDDLSRSTECISCVQTGVTTREAGTRGYELSADGGTAVFETPERLVPSDVNGDADIYQWHNGVVGLITDGATKFPGGLVGGTKVRGVSASGRDIFFSVAAPLTGFEHDGLSNLYDARIGGGFPPPSAAVHCDGDACQGGLEVPPASVRSASSTFSGNGNVAPKGRPRCRHAKLRRKGRCVSKRCRKQAKAKKRCLKRQASNQQRSQRNHKGGAK